MTSSAASSYSTGGGGVRLEHEYAATVLAAVLTGDPLAELGDQVTPVAVHLQASDIAPVDDVVIEGRTTSGGIRRVAVGVRRNPALTKSDETSIPLIGAFLRVVTDDWAAVEAGHQRVALVVAISSSAVRQLEALAVIAQSVRSAQEFRSAIARPRATNEGVRGRLVHVDALVVKAVAEDDKLSSVAADELTWRWLLALTVRVVSLEGVNTGDRTASVTSLRGIVYKQDLATADSVFAALAEQAGAWASAGGHVDQTMLRRALSNFPIERSPSLDQAWSMLDGLSRRLREGIRPGLESGEKRLELNRQDACESLKAAMVRAGQQPSPLVVTGEPDVGKSALVLRASEQLLVKQASVTSLSLRDLPSSVLSTEAQLGGSLGDVAAGTAVRQVRLLVLDGAEAVLEGRGPLFKELTVAALRAGLGVVAVTRTDGSARVRELLSEAARLVGSLPTFEHIVSGLDAGERDEVRGTFPTLGRLTNDGRNEWLIGRPGLLDLLLRSGTSLDSALLLSEADVFVAVWDRLVRRQEESTESGVSPDDRERAMLYVARRSLKIATGSLPSGGALSSLRSDGMLRIPASVALSTGDEFSSDLVRDLALARLFLLSGWEPLIEASAPRWAIRAVRLACQGRLLTNERAGAWRELVQTFEGISSSEGERWAEVPVEALLALGDAQSAIESVWGHLLLDDKAGLSTLVRLAQQRHIVEGFGDPFALDPLISVLFLGDHDLGQHDYYKSRYGLGKEVRELVLAWLRGLARDQRDTDSLRGEVRDVILAVDPESYDEFAVEALATLGADLDDRAESFLRQVADNDPYRILPAIESIGSIISMTVHNPELMLYLAEMYYIERPDRDDDWYSLHEREGIRDHKPSWGFGEPQAGWWFGPFWRLLNTKPLETLGFINRMLDHAAQSRLTLLRPNKSGDTAGDAPDAGLKIEIPGIGLRRYMGDAHVWSWYRGSGVGPYPCISALLAVERFADHLVDTLNLPIRAVIQSLLRDSHNLAMPGLVVGLLVRHLDDTEDLLDPWLREPHAWRLESSRTASEGFTHAQGRDPDNLAGRDRRKNNFRDTAAEMTMRAMQVGNQTRLAELSEVAEGLLANARRELGDGQQADEQFAVVEGWAAVLSAENYQISRAADNSGWIIQHTRPERIAKALAPVLEQLGSGNQAARLEMAYSNGTSFPLDQLLVDIDLAQQLSTEPSVFGPLNPMDPIAAVAAATITEHASARATIDTKDLEWAAQILIAAALDPHTDEMSYNGTIYPMAADRAAARGLPLLLLERFDHIALDRSSISSALQAIATSSYDEVRVALAPGASPIWAAPCSGTSDGGCSRHEPMWRSIESALSQCRLGPWDPDEQRRSRKLLPPPYPQTLADIPDNDLIASRLAMPISCTIAARETECLTGAVEALLPVLLAANIRSVNHLREQGYGGYERRDREIVARALLELSIAGQDDSLLQHVHSFTSNANALQQFLDDLADIFTYDDSLRSTISDVWPSVLSTALDAVDAGADLKGSRHWVDYAVSGLLPTPKIRPEDGDVDGTLARVRSSWIEPTALFHLIDRWIDLAKHEPKAADAVARFALCNPMTWQLGHGLDWAERIIDGRFDSFANRCWFLTNWLSFVRERAQLIGESMRRWRRLIDGLAAAGDSKAADLQRVDE